MIQSSESVTDGKPQKLEKPGADELLVLLTANFGARPGELCRATIGDIDRTANAIILREHKTARKTGKPRRIPIGRKLGELLAQAIGERQSGPIFLSPAGKAWTVPNLSRTYSRLRDLAGLPRDLVLYLARHECGTKICREKGIEYARRLLGNANI